MLIIQIRLNHFVSLKKQLGRSALFFSKVTFLKQVKYNE
ncbi:hypothetical protein RV09_GL000231 [Enterococcus moraviensis]|nr:hypothetical protein RV09_GL000231 [Enterococcus moraviensis]